MDPAIWGYAKHGVWHETWGGVEGGIRKKLGGLSVKPGWWNFVAFLEGFVSWVKSGCPFWVFLHYDIFPLFFGL